MGRKSEVHTIDSLGRKNVGVFRRGGAEAEKDPGKMMKPVRHSGASSEGSLEAAVEVLNQTIGLRIVGGGRLMSDVKETIQVKPKGRCKLGPWSEVIIEGTPNLEIQVWMRAEAQSAAAMEERGIASSQREERSITVRRYV